MISYLRIKNFKSLKKLSIKPSLLNLCFGMNGMGKSTLLQFMLLLRHSHEKGLLSSKGLLLQHGDVSIGTGKDAFYQYAARDELVECEIRTKDGLTAKWSFALDPESDILPVAAATTEGNHRPFDLNELSLFSPGFSYLSADRMGPQKVYAKSDFEVVRNRNTGSRGEYAVHYLSRFGMSEKIACDSLLHPKARSHTLLHQTIAWLGDITPGARLVIDDIQGADLLRLGVQFETKDGYTNEFSSFNVGFGLLYVLPVILELLRARPGDLVFLENPESHLHPKGQSTIGRLMAAAGANGVQIFCESHSDHIINGARVAVKEGIITPEDLAIYYFARDHEKTEHLTSVTAIDVDKHGELNSYPRGLLDEWTNLLIKLV